LGRNRDYTIDIYKLSNTRHDYHFVFEDSFFGEFENSVITKGKGEIDVELDKSPTFIKVDFRIIGSVELICDRSNDLYDFPLDTKGEIILKFGENTDEISDTIEIIPWETQRIDLAQYIYEFIGLAVPMKKLHPRYSNDDETDGIVFSTEIEKDQTEKNEIDPRWSKLGKLKNLKEKKNGAS
jgi:uncharacterized metal-binding protein YceD (DUF177 family)